MSFQIEALPVERFASLLSLPDEQLAAHRAEWRIADSWPGYPCRVSLVDAEVGERVLLVNYLHLDTQSPYRASHAIFIREGAATAHPAPGEVPEVLRRRLLSLRAFDSAGNMLGADVVHGREVEPRLTALLDTQDVAFVDMHNAGPGCFAARARPSG